MIFVDTNYFIRFLLDDSNDQAKIAQQLFEGGVSKEKDLYSTTIVFFEIYWVFKSFYKKSDTEIYKILFGVLSMEFIYFEEREILKKALEIFKKSNLGLEDSYNIAYFKIIKGSGFRTFDKKLARNLI